MAHSLRMRAPAPRPLAALAITAALSIAALPTPAAAQIAGRVLDVESRAGIPEASIALIAADGTVWGRR
ncbi:MAG: hypothetical protein RQ751_13895 [Longimicrobiales bacterium]|nr:hypothetical protein [Longimicrobiales bacterium]